MLAILVPGALRCQAPQGAQVLAIGSGVGYAQQIINSMPAGADREALQRALDNFRKMRNEGRLRVRPRPGSDANGAGGTGPRGAFTTAEYTVVIPPGGVGGSGGGESGSTPGVGEGDEFIELGGGLGSGEESLVGDEDGQGAADPEYSSMIFLHEGSRCQASWTRAANNTVRNNHERYLFFNSEYEAYLLDWKYCNAAIAWAEANNKPATLIDHFTKWRRRVSRLALNNLANREIYRTW